MNANYGCKNDIAKGLEEVINFQFDAYNINPQFSESVEALRESDISVVPCYNRRDFREEKAFTIDCADCKDMDDAVSIAKTPLGYRLAVHIADVAAYVPLGSELDSVATSRATSIYLPNLTVPMLPKVLSNNLCSLNPGVDRFTLSVIANIDKKGKVMSYEITKGQICSRVKGIYSEVNKLLSGEKDDSLAEKYSQVLNELFDMAELYEILRNERLNNGANIMDSNKPKISIYKHDITLTPTSDGIAENAIEEFMILANRIVSEYLYDNNLPAIFRTQVEKNNLASYQPVKNRHEDLALESYSHFTSPIRRIADLKIHQILTMHLNGSTDCEIRALFDGSLIDVCERATKRSRTAKHVQVKCERYCYEQFFRLHRDNTYTGKLVGFDRKNRPLVQIKEYNIKVIGYKLINGTIGDFFSFKVKVCDKNNEFIAIQAHRLVA